MAPQETDNRHYALTYAQAVDDAHRAGRMDSIPSVTATFALSEPTEKCFAQGEFVLAEFRAVGDGTYLHNGSWFVAGGPVGALATVGFMTGRALRNGARKREAARDAVPRWIECDRGRLWVSSHGIYFHSQQGFQRLHWGSLANGEMVGPGQFMFATYEQGDQLILASVWAELAFTSWARARHPNHPQYVSRTWLPPELRASAPGAIPGEVHT